MYTEKQIHAARIINAIDGTIANFGEELARLELAVYNDTMRPAAARRKAASLVKYVCCLNARRYRLVSRYFLDEPTTMGKINMCNYAPDFYVIGHEEYEDELLKFWDIKK